MFWESFRYATASPWTNPSFYRAGDAKCKKQALPRLLRDFDRGPIAALFVDRRLASRVRMANFGVCRPRDAKSRPHHLTMNRQAGISGCQSVVN